MGRNKNRRRTALLIAVFAGGLALMFYPSVSDMWNTHYQKQLISSYGRDVALADDNTIGYELEKARAYNDELWPTPEPEGFAFLDENDPSPEYMDCLNLNGDGIMGYVSIPKIDVELQIYHTTEGDTMNLGAGHLEGTSLPVGGESTHSVLAAHRGLPGARLFSDLNKLEEGDHFYLYVLGETLCYEVDQIKVVEPDDVSDLVITPGEDYCTLLTCTPYGVNTERLLVRGHRVPYSEVTEQEEINTPPVKMYLQRWLFLAALGVGVAGTAVILRGRQKRNRAALSRSRLPMRRHRRCE